MISGWNLCNLWRECPRGGQLNIGRAMCHWNRGISSLNQLTLIFEIVTFIRCNRWFMISRWNVCILWRECSRSGQLRIGPARCHWSRGISSLNQLTLIFEFVTFSGVTGWFMISGWNVCNLWRECSGSGQLRIGRARCHWNRGISSLNQLTLIFEMVTFIRCYRVIHDFGLKCM